MTRASSRARGVLPDEVIRDPRADGFLTFATLDSTLDADGVQAWLKRASELVAELEASSPRDARVATVAVGFGPSFFQTAPGTPRFGLDSEQIPAGLREPPPLEVADAAAAARHVAFYIMSLAEAPVAQFLRGLSETRALRLQGALAERGYQRADRREHFGFLDGLRNVPREQRAEAVFIDRDRAPEEPGWVEGGTYMAYLKVRQDLERAARMSEGELEAVLGRRRADGSRLDLPAGTDPREEKEMAPDTPSAASHVRKSGPRGSHHDRTAIFRRGVPYLTLLTDGSLDAGLQFVSFQDSVDDFLVILRRWMNNPAFPAPGAGPDALFTSGLATLVQGGLYFMPPPDRRFIGAQIFDPPQPAPSEAGRIVLRKRAVDQNGQQVLAELGGIRFQVFNQGGNAIGEPFETDSAGHAVSADLPLNEPLLLRELLPPPSNFQPLPDVEVTLTRRRHLVRVNNVVIAPGAGYGG
jgi:deferrochelatase/peroxidase EfeB